MNTEQSYQFRSLTQRIYFKTLGKVRKINPFNKSQEEVHLEIFTENNIQIEG